MNTQPVTLRLADNLEKHVGGNIAFRSAAELRRLHEENTALRQAIEQAEKQELAVQHLWECLGRWSSYLAVNGTKANMAPPNWLLDAVKAATSQSPKREWVGLTDEKIKDMYNKAINETATVSQFVMFKTFARAIEAKLRKRNT